MAMGSIKLTLSGLTPLEVEDLRAALAQAGGDPASLQATKVRGEVAGARKGEPFTIMVVLAVSQIAITGLALYLAKGRSRTQAKQKIRITTPDGGEVEYELEIASDREEAIRADLMEQVEKLRIPTPSGLAGLSTQ